MASTYVVPLLKILVLLNCVLVSVTFMILLERKIIAWVQVRLGPMRVGPYGSLQPIADAIKLLLKEDITPARADKWVFTLAPIVSMVPALIAFAVIPFDREATLFGYRVPLFVADVNVGLLYIVSITSIGVYGIILAGYASNSKFPLLAGLRASAQLISYEIAVTMMLVSIVATAGTLSMVGIVEAQHNARRLVRLPPAGRLRDPVHRRARRDQPRALRPAGGGAGADRRLPHRVQRHALRAVLPRRIREHDRRVGGGDDAVFRRVAAAVSATSRRWGSSTSCPGWMWFLLKTFVFLYVFIWIRATLPRYRYDQLMRLGWKVLIPLAIANLVVTAILEGAVVLRGHLAEALDMLESIVFYTLAAFILGFGVLVVTARNTVHSVLFLVANFLCVAMMYVLLAAEFLAIIQVLVYAGGIVVLYLFVVMLVNLQRPPEAHDRPAAADRASGFVHGGAAPRGDVARSSCTPPASRDARRRPRRTVRRRRAIPKSSAGCSTPTI